tara:strand:- start:634 stop:777 length:144 start_codon:yes stop_codon:yes gene_type:complete
MPGGKLMLCITRRDISLDFLSELFGDRQTLALSKRNVLSTFKKTSIV